MSRNRRGAAGQQYAIIVGLIAVVAILAVTQVGSNTKALFSNVSNRLTGATNGTTGSAPQTPESALYAFTSHTFTPCGAIERLGPELPNCISSYTPVDGNWHTFPANFTIGTGANERGYQKWTVPSTGVYRIEAAGAGTSTSGYFGARLRGDFMLNKGEFLLIAVGQSGKHQSDGSGGSFVARGGTISSATALIVAGGSTGYYQVTGLYNSATYLPDYSLQEPGGTRSGYSGPTGSNGSGGGGFHSGGGGGFSGNGGTNGVITTGNPSGIGFRDGLMGGTYSNGTYQGGFGGGGARHTSSDGEGGGGGYSGGRSGVLTNERGFGGGSYTAPEIISNSRAELGIDRSGAGYVTITKL